MSPAVVLAVTAFALLVLAAALGPHRLVRWWRRAFPPRPAPPAPSGRPIEAIAADMHRLGAQFRYPPERASFTRFEARRRAYDGVLGEACAALGVAHLLHVLPPGTEQDRERDRVELVLDCQGFSPHLLP